MSYFETKRVQKFFAVMRRINRRQFFGYLVLLTVIVYTILHHYINRPDCKKSIEYNNDIDIVYTWVNGSDEKFLETIKKYTDKISMARFDNKNELKYSLRSLEKYAPWVQHVYIVTNGQIPSWLNLEYEKVSVVPHHQLAPDPDILPTFSSNVIEQFLHRIPNLSKRFLYLNDDMFLGLELYPEELYTPSRGIHIYTSKSPPLCAPSCPWSRLKDGECDQKCNVPECEFDGNDCAQGKKYRKIPDKISHNIYQRSLINTSKVFNLAYGLKKRNAIPHIGYLFDKDIIEDMLVKFRKEFTNTSFNKFRTIDDMLFPYSFFHYLMSETRDASPEEVFDYFDLDKSGIWSDEEIRVSCTHLHLVPLNSSNTNEQYFEELLISCFNNSRMDIIKDMNSSNFPKVTRNLVTKCASLSEILVKRFSKRKKYQFQVTSRKLSPTNFMFLTSNITEVKLSLDKIKRNPKKFNCIGDKTILPNTNKNTDKERLMVKELLDNFYKTLFPHPSKFELPLFEINRYNYYDEYLKQKSAGQSIFYGVLSALLIFFIFVCFLKSNYSCKYCKDKVRILV